MTDYSIKRFSKYTEDELIAKLQDFAKESGRSFVSGKAFEEATGISEGTATNHFGSWQEFCARAGLAPRYQRSVSRTGLFENLDRVWQSIGRQPRAKEMKQPLSPISVSRYSKEFKCSWYHICLEFLAQKSGASASEIERESQQDTAPSPAHRTRRGISLSLRYAVLMRDGFRCVKCGHSPAITPGVKLHIDHAQAWANGGETILENLQTLCSDCNLGKSNRHDG
jgi:hypothetical protein